MRGSVLFSGSCSFLSGHCWAVLSPWLVQCRESRVLAAPNQAEGEFAFVSADEVDGVRQAYGSPARHAAGGRSEGLEAASPVGWELSLLSHTPSKSTPSMLTYLKGKSRIARRLHMNGILLLCEADDCPLGSTATS